MDRPSADGPPCRPRRMAHVARAGRRGQGHAGCGVRVTTVRRRCNAAVALPAGLRLRIWTRRCRKKLRCVPYFPHERSSDRLSGSQTNKGPRQRPFSFSSYPRSGWERFFTSTYSKSPWRQRRLSRLCQFNSRLAPYHSRCLRKPPNWRSEKTPNRSVSIYSIRPQVPESTSCQRGRKKRSFEDRPL